ncbi:hypothetical protein [Streptomyces sp. NBC_01723]|uniref:hypothetical protein n=1 Tax=Streptomyces sp. NBC_01723 TaxID=2975921 RepID=UPI003FCD3501
MARTHVQHILTAMACNVARIADWIDTHPEHDAGPRTSAPCAQPPHDMPDITNRVLVLRLRQAGVEPSGGVLR